MAIRAARRLQCLLLTGTILTLPSLAHAQAGPDVQAQVTTAKPASSATSAIGEIVVTAQRRAERLVDVPITITSVSAAKLNNAGVTASNALSQVVPAFRLDYNGAFAQPTIRGVSTALANVGGGSSVGVYIDGFYNASPLTQDFEFLNVSNIQVLKGPQGTLFGRNTTAGAVLVTTSEPSQTTSVQAKVDYSSFDTIRTSFYGTTGIAKGLSVDAGVLYKYTNGWFTNLTNGDDHVGRGHNFSARVGVKYEFDDTGSNYILARGIYTKLVDPTSMDWSVYRDPDGKYESAAYAFAALFPGALFGKDNRHIATDPGFTPLFRSQLKAAQLTGKFDLGFATLTSYTQYRKENSRQDLEVDDSSVPIFRVAFNNYDNLKTQEVLLNSKPGGRLQWVMGAFYMDQTAQEKPFGAITPLVNPAYDTYINIKSISGFGDATWQPVDKLFITFGARYSSEKDRGHWDCFDAGYQDDALTKFCPRPLGPTVVRTSPPDHTFNSFTPRGVIRYQITPGSNVYASITKGYKAGLLDVNGFNNAGDPPYIKPEKITAYEGGYKLSTGKTHLELSGFYYDYKDLQVSIYVGTQSITTNAASSKVYGGELQVSQNLFDNFNVSGGVAWTHGRYSKYPGAPGNVFDYTTGTADNTPVDASGNHMIRSPDWTGNITLDDTFDVAQGKLNLNANVYYSSKIYFDAANNNEQKAYAVMNVRAAWTDPSDHFTFAAYCNNLTNKAYISQVLPNGPGTGVAWNAPRVIGGSIAYKY